MFLLDWMWGALAWMGLANKEAKIIFLGLDNAGKTTLMHVLKAAHLKQFEPTFHPTKEDLTIGKINFHAWDLGGHESARRIWQDYFPVVDAVVFIVDVADRERIDEAAKELDEIMQNPQLEKLPILVLGNKIDLPQAMSEEELSVKLQLHQRTTGKGKVEVTKDTRPCEIFMCSIVNREGYGEGFRWLSEYL
jgi:GTP-binding protein SAR1